MARINIDKLYLSKITKDEIGVGNLIFSAPEYIPGVQLIDVKFKVDIAKNYEEGILRQQNTTLTDITVNFDLGHFSNAQYAKYLGHHIANEGGVYALENDTAPDVAILFKYTLADGKHGYKVLYKGQLTEMDDSIKQKEGKINYQNHSVSCSFLPLQNNGMWQYGVEEGDADCPANIDTDFFANVIIPTEKIGA